jgi:hypothetical protein
VGDDAYLMGTPTPIPVGQTTNVINGSAIFVGNFAYPVTLQLTPALASNSLYSASASYDHQ